MYDQQMQAVLRRRQTLRMVFIGIIALTTPFYCIGFYLWGNAPANLQPDRTTATFTPIGGDDQGVTVTHTVQAIVTTTLQPTSTLRATPTQGFPPIFPTRFLSATPILFPTNTIAPTLTFAPTNTPITPTNTQPVIIPPTNTPTWTSIPPTATPFPPTATFTVEPPTATATVEVLLPPSETPTPAP